MEQKFSVDYVEVVKQLLMENPEKVRQASYDPDVVNEFVALFMRKLEGKADPKVAHYVFKAWLIEFVEQENYETLKQMALIHVEALKATNIIVDGKIDADPVARTVVIKLRPHRPVLYKLEFDKDAYERRFGSTLPELLQEENQDV